MVKISVNKMILGRLEEAKNTTQINTLRIMEKLLKELDEIFGSIDRQKKSGRSRSSSIDRRELDCLRFYACRAWHAVLCLVEGDGFSV